MAERLSSPSPSPDALPAAINAPFMNQNDAIRASILSTSDASPRGSKLTLPTTSAPLLLDKEAPLHTAHTNANSRKRSLIRWVIAAAILLVIVVLAVVLPVYFTIIKPNNHRSAAASAPSDDNHSSAKPTSSAVPHIAITGGDGSIVTAEDGSTFTYQNKFGGFWVADPNDPLNNNAQPNSWTPPLNQSWDYSKNRIYGVNLGGWLVLEPFISPALYQKYDGASDEWSLSTAMAADTASGGLNQLEDHYRTFITEQDFAAIAGAGLNWIRLPLPFWAVEKWDDEPFLEKVSWKYALKAFQWARKYGLRVNLDLHTIPGSQNGYNHSGKGKQVNFLHGVMGYANAQRALEYIRVITEFISQPQYKDVVVMFGVVNEALATAIGIDVLSSFYLQVHDMIRSITGKGEGNGPFISIHDSFRGISTWNGFLEGSDRIALDTHPYFAFGGQAATEPIATGTGINAGGKWPTEACDRWAQGMNGSRTGFGVSYAGEFSNGYNDCGLFLRGIDNTHTYGGDCSQWEDASLWDESVKAGLMQFTKASMDAFGDWFFWTWKIGNSTAGRVEAPLWSYSLGLEGGWIPRDPRTALGTCAALGVDGPDFDGNYKPWQTGGAGAGDIPATSTSQFPWPPATISGADVAVTELPSYTSTGAIVSLPPPTMTATDATKSVDFGNGWFNAQDTALAPTPITGCQYPDAWNAEDVAAPPLCS